VSGQSELCTPYSQVQPCWWGASPGKMLVGLGCVRSVAGTMGLRREIIGGSCLMVSTLMPYHYQYDGCIVQICLSQYAGRLMGWAGQLGLLGE